MFRITPEAGPSCRPLFTMRAGRRGMRQVERGTKQARKIEQAHTLVSAFHGISFRSFFFIFSISL